MKRSVTAALALVLGSSLVPGLTPVLLGQVADTLSVDAPNLTGVVQTYCQVCHNDAMMTGNLSLAGFEVENASSMA